MAANIPCFAIFKNGEQFAVAIARAVAVKPKLLFLDEPTSAMNDEETVALVAGGHTFGKCHGAGPPVYSFHVLVLLYD